MSKKETYKFGSLDDIFFRKLYNLKDFEKNPEKFRLYKITIYNRIAKKICRNCYCQLPLNSNVCRKCKNSDLRTKKVHYQHNQVIFDKSTKNKLIDKENIV